MDKMKSIEKAENQEGASRHRKASAEPKKRVGHGEHHLPSPLQVAGNLATERLIRSGQVESKLTVNSPNDSSEREADRAAEQVMHMPESSPLKAKSRTDTGGNSAPNELVQSLGSGQALDPETRTFFEERFGADFSHIRVHTDEKAVESARAIEAEAYTAGADIVFGAARYNPTTPEGKRLLSHELAHVLQQSKRSQSGRLRADSGTTGIIQRQPTPTGLGMLTDPMAFIESQLRLRFTDPDDPKLIVRVQQLQAAFDLLSLPEAKRLLERLEQGARGDELAKNFQRLATPSRQKLLGRLRRQLPANIQGNTLGTISSSIAPTIGVPLVAKFEVTPSTEEAGTFSGYRDQSEAREAAVRRPTITAIVFDKKLEKYRVFETGVPTLRGQQSPRVMAHETGLDYRFVDWVNLVGGELPDPAERVERIKKAHKMRENYLKTYGTSLANPIALENVQTAYKQLFEEALPFARGQFHTSLELNDPKDKTKSWTTADPSLINIDIFDLYVHGRMSLIDPMSHTLNFPGAHSRASMQQAFQGVLPVQPEPYISLSLSALSGDPWFTLGVLKHEETHRAHVQLALQLFDEWRNQSSTPSFKNYLEQQVKKQRISQVEAILALEQSKPSSGLRYHTELLAEVEGFTSSFHVLAPDPKNNEALQDFTKIPVRWERSESDVQELTIRKLQYYIQRLDQPHREAFDKFVVEKSQEPNNPNHEFYLKMSEISGALFMTP